MMDKKNPISIILMVVGVIFVLVAGCIFVTTAWKYLPEFVKQLALLGISAGLFAGSYYVNKKTELRFTESALYYLAVAFLGFFTVSILGGLVALDMDGYAVTRTVRNANQIRFLAGLLVTFVPVLLRTLKRKKAFDAGVGVVVLDFIVLYVLAAFDFKFETGCLVCGIILLVFSVLDSLLHQKYPELKGLGIVITVNYILGLCICGLMFFVLSLLPHTILGISSLVMMLYIIATFVSYKGFDSVAYRVMNSVAIFWGIFTVGYKLYCVLDSDLNGQFFVLAILLGAIAVTFLMRRMEMLVMVDACGILLAFIQILLICDNEIFVPFSFVLLVAGLLYGQFVSENRIVKLHGLIHGGLGVVLLLAWIGKTYLSADSFGLVFILYFAIHVALFMMIAVACKGVVKQILETLALANFVITMIGIVGYIFQVPEAYLMECDSAVMAAGIVLLGKIWYDKKVASIIQFVCTCILLFVLLIYNMAVEGVFHVFFLAVVALVILLVAVWKNDKKYVYAGAITLILIAIYLTRTIWLNIAWWVYLFVVGVALIVIAIKKERDK